jgi:phosphate transport system substrate-binding protein
MKRSFIILVICLLCGDLALAVIIRRSGDSVSQASKPCVVSLSQLPKGDNRLGYPLSLPYLNGARMHISGSTALGPLIQSAADTFNQSNHTGISVEQSSSILGLQALLSHQTDMAMSDVFIQDANIPVSGVLYDYFIAILPFTIIVNEDLKSTITNLDTQQIQEIISGKATNWKAFGGPSEDVQFVNRPANSGSRIAFSQWVLGVPSIVDKPTSTSIIAQTSNDVIEKVTQTKGAIGYVAVSDINSIDTATKSIIYPVCINGVGATISNVADGSYPFWSIEHLYTSELYSAANNPQSVERAFLDFVCAGDFQAKNVLTFGMLHSTQLQDYVMHSHSPQLSSIDNVQLCPF